MAASCYIAAFDISDDRERRRVVKVLEGFGLRVQKSVFECRLSVSGMRRLTRALEAESLATGFCAIYRAGGHFSRTVVGQAEGGFEQEDGHAFKI